MKLNVFVLSLLFSLGLSGVFGQEQETRPTVIIKTNTVCGDCKKRVEGVLNFEKGIIYAEVNLEKHEIKVKYNSKRTSLEEIRKKISEIGYAADHVEPVKEAQMSLPACCQPGGHD
ncbi:MAG: heavy-metal-associated domain-containing protein [Brumimicrobium sp.]